MSENTPLFDTAEVQKALAVTVDPGSVFEVRILEPRRGGRGYAPRVIYGYFDDLAKVPDALNALRLEGAKGIYVTLNPVNPALLARSHNKFTGAKDGQTTSDKDILCRRWLLVDADPKRPAGISASDEEKAHAHARARAIYTHLKEAGWPEPVAADSGNGYHLLYRVDLPSDDETVKHCLTALDQKFSDDKTTVDTTVFNPARIVKLYGTRAEKGDDCPDLARPHRLSKLLLVPEKTEAVPAGLLDALAAQAKAPPAAPPVTAPPRKAQSGARLQSWDRTRVQEFIDKHLANCRPGPATPYDGGFKWVLGICPFNPEHTNRSAVIVIKADGVLGFKCQHDGCKGNNWKALRAKFEPRSETPHEEARPTVLDVPGDDDLVAQYGPPVMVNSKGEPTHVNQMFVAAKFGRDNLILHEPTLNQFYDYHPDTGLWQVKTEARLLVELGVSLRDMLNECGGGIILKQRTENLLGQILRLLKGIVERPEAFRRTQPIIHVGNGVLHLDTDPPPLNEFSPDYYSRNRSEICFDEQADCPRFVAELLRPALDEDDISLLQRYAGQCLLGRNPSQRILLLRGTPGGGKSTLANILESVIGTHNVTQLRVQHLAERFEIAGFVGKTLLSGKDVPGDFLNNKSAYVLKALVGGDRLDAEQKNVKHRFELLGEFNILITSNTRLHVRLDADSGAWRRRLLIVDYERPPTEKPIPNFDRRLVESEGPGILNWCIAGALQLLNELDTYGKVQLTDAHIKRVDALLSESDSVRHFVSERVTTDSASDITVNELQTAYHNFCEEQGWQAVTVRQFEHQVSDIMMEIHRVAKRTDIKRNEKNQRGFAHVTLKHEETA
jgi:P4 family phage/plasmid primase-like protien